ncbi:MAG: D-alanyl-D-alanine carboxypeptidase/D-alanyl-D-alanine-endopeptidase [Gammaproteobacteria bacterium]|nr:D-alanyl-D-alanine carboxypeptidase/D-alanyl-D-alanine-endopeptidase [Gammaproteobacteria bacterium]MBT8093546.1 D-alanyl-D-alanine carboxypeptidase/D-alanyl-D-alanine-endopeptidase [Gammaproteobacteria bacterium]MBT8106490.1 D-alanyl-D-alanine carboxypeptidase/D-alanyl-D-alanine-endopeptidase [Gammaproteobacteria bacterium]NNF49381.1 D-alanyl-D-alanine carboxypeptidase/D-alanyl-D-alanine-endopeptidase [Woeseiaceae bacterium]NNK26505.1 D-alanyl-D-alanine carboxypeptidase/D-alanyl-D-alanine-e
MKPTITFLFILLLFAAWADAAAEIPAGVRGVLQTRQVPDSSLSIYVEDLDSGEVVLDWLGDVPRNPASTMKLLTTLVALDVLGPAYRWRTDVYALGEIADGKLDGDLLVKGHGDPFLVAERVWRLLRQIRYKGIDEITGDLLIDDSWFDVGDYDPAAFDNQPLRAYNVAPNALLTNFKVVRYWFEPDGERVRVRMDPELDNLRIDNRLSVRQGYCRGFQRGIAVNVNGNNDEVIFSGRFPSGCERYAMDRTALSHNAFTYGLFRSLWEESGGVLEGSWSNVLKDDLVKDEETEPLVSFRSPPLVEMIARVNKHSNNVMARQVLYTLSAEVNGPPGTETGGREVIETWLQQNKLGSCKMALENGAGLSRETRICASGMAAMLRFAWHQPYMPEYLASMSLSGLDGTLRRRFTGSELVGTAHLKTGSLDHVAAIAGYLQARSGRRFAVVALHNHDDIHRGYGEEVQEALLRWLYDQ